MFSFRMGVKADMLSRQWVGTAWAGRVGNFGFRSGGKGLGGLGG